MAEISPQEQLVMNQTFIQNSLEKNYRMEQFNISRAGQFLDMELDKVPGWATYIDLNVELNINITGTTAPTLSQFAPYNFFREIAISLGGGPFIRTNAYYYYLREVVSNYGWSPGQSSQSYPYAQQTLYNIPTLQIGANKLKYTIRVPLQTQPGTTMGLMPMGSSATTLKIQISTTNALYGTDHYYNPIVGGTGITDVSISTSVTSFVQPVIQFLTHPTTRSDIPSPRIGYVLNVQEKVTQFVGAGSLTPLKFNDPFRYLRLYFIVIDGTGQPNSTSVNQLELDLMPSYPQYQYSDKTTLSSYYYDVRRRYGQDLPPGVFIFDLMTGSDVFNPNGTQTIDATLFQTMQAQLAVDANTNVQSPAKIITFAEALSPVNF